ncbi:hypothetical protein ACN28S_22060 [Cystobacter fuscus]
MIATTATPPDATRSARATEEQAELVRTLVMHNTARPPPEELPDEEELKRMDV